MSYLYLYVFSLPRRKKKIAWSQFFKKLKVHSLTKRMQIILPVQLCPSPSCPGLQKQLNDPRVLLHQAFSWQLLFAALHSSMSKNKPSEFKGASTRKDKHKHCKTALSVVLQDFHKVVVWLLKEYTGTANVTRNTLLWNSLPSCFASVRREPHTFSFGF